MIKVTFVPFSHVFAEFDSLKDQQTLAVVINSSTLMSQNNQFVVDSKRLAMWGHIMY